MDSYLLESYQDERNDVSLEVTSKGRGCTNFFCLFVYYLYWIGLIVLFIVGAVSGNPNRLWFATDYQGNLCGAAPYSSEKYVYYPRVTQDIMTYLTRVGVFALSIIETLIFHQSMAINLSDLTSGQLVNVNLFGLCQKSCPQTGDVVCTADYLANSTHPTPPPAADLQNCGKQTSEVCSNCWVVPLNTSSVLYRCMYETGLQRNKTEVCTYPNSALSASDPLCVSKQEIIVQSSNVLAHQNPVMEQILTWKSRINGAFSDMLTTLPYLLMFGVGASLVLGFFYIGFVKMSLSCIIYFLLVALILGSVAFTAFCFFQAGYFTMNDVMSAFSQISDEIARELNRTGGIPISSTTVLSNQKYWEIASWVMLPLDIIVLVLVIFVWSRLNFVSEIVKESTSLLFRFPSVFLVPLFVVVQFAGVAVFFSFSTGLLLTMPTRSEVSFSPEKYLETCKLLGMSECSVPMEFSASGSSSIGLYSLLANVFGLLWSVLFIEAIFYMILAGVVGQWYFTPNRTPEGDRKCFLCQSLFRVYRFHLGTAALGSFVLAFIRFIRWMIMFVERHTNNSSNKCLKCIACCCCCCFWCIEKCVKYLSKNAYILTSIRGYGFMKASKQSFEYITHNIARFGILSTVSTLISFLGKASIATLCTLGSYFYFTGLPAFKYGGSTELMSPIVPVICVLLLSYMVSSVFMSLHSFVGDSILMCFLEDESRMKGKSPYTPRRLQKFVSTDL